MLNLTGKINCQVPDSYVTIELARVCSQLATSLADVGPSLACSCLKYTSLHPYLFRYHHLDYEFSQFAFIALRSSHIDICLY
jgi:hypothetical protein